MEPIEQTEQVKKERKANPWLLHVKEIKDQNGDKTYKEILQLAKESYVKKDKPEKTPRKRTKKVAPVEEDSD